MAILDRREPGIYVTVEDASYIAPTTEIGRTGYFVILSDRGPHNRIVTISSQNQLHETFGKPNYRKNSQSHYIADKFLQMGGKALVCRVVPSGYTSPNTANNAMYSNSLVMETTIPATQGESIIIKPTSGKFKFLADSTHKTYVYAYDSNAFKEIDIGEYIYLETDSHDKAIKVKSKVELTDAVSKANRYNYRIILTSDYAGTENDVWSRANTTMDPDIVKEESVGSMDFVYGSRYVTINIAAVDEYNNMGLGTWIYPVTTTINYARQVVNKSVIYDDGEIIGYRLLLDKGYTGISVADTTIYKIKPYYASAVASIYDEDSFVMTYARRLFWFYSLGVGTYYNNLVIKGVRNTALEKMYTDSDGNTMYKYMFMDIGIYRYNDDGSTTLMEGPWSVSLARTTPEEYIIRDLSSGSVLFIEDVINDNSKLIKCVSGVTANDKMINDTNSEMRRLQVMTLFSNREYDAVIGTHNYGAGGIVLRNGTDGYGQYDSVGNLNAQSYLLGLVGQAYDGSLESVDGTVEQLTDYVYPSILPDYIVTGGFPASVQTLGRQLADLRQDCICLADTGGYKTSASDDMTARADDVPWNSWNSMLYIQYRKMFDVYTGENIWFSPVYHAVERHLYTD